MVGMFGGGATAALVFSKDLSAGMLASTAFESSVGALAALAPPSPGPVAFTGLLVLARANCDKIIDNLDQAIAEPVSSPLPRLGVDAAFGSSRKMRRRIKHAA
jgi:hypothetical protein